MKPVVRCQSRASMSATRRSATRSRSSSGDQVHVQRQQVDRLGVALDEAVLADVGPVERRDDVPVQLLVVRLAIGSPQHAGDARHELRVVGQVRGREHLARRVRADGQPVAVVVVAPRAPQQVRVVADEVREVALHRVPVALEDPHVAVALVDRPRHDDPGVGPRGRAVTLRAEPGSHVRVCTFRRLRIEDVVAPLGDEGGDVHVQRRAGQEDLRVGEPAEPLVALRAVGGDRQEVAALRPRSTLRQSWLTSVARALEPPGPGRVGVDDAAGDRRGLARGR